MVTDGRPSAVRHLAFISGWFGGGGLQTTNLLGALDLTSKSSSMSQTLIVVSVPPVPKVLKKEERILIAARLARREPGGLGYTSTL